MEKISTTCPWCGCGCGLYLHVENNLITGVSPNRNHPVNHGTLCVKGWNCHEFVRHPDRLTTPLIKDGKTSYRRVSWEEGLGVTAARLAEIKKQHGPDAIGILGSAKCTNEDNFVLMKFARAVIGTNNVDHCARLCHSSTVGGLAAAFGSGAMTNSIDEIRDARVIFVIGSNTTEQHPMIGMHMLEAKDRGATLIVADPRRTQIAQFSHLHMRHKSGTDVALLNAMMHVIITEGLVDISFIRQRTENFDDFESSVRAYTPEVAESITSVPADDIRKAARLYASEKRSMLFYSMGITQHITGVDNVRSCANLVMLTAHIGQPMTGLNPLRGQNNVQGACDVGALPDVYSGYQKVADPAARKKFELAWSRTLPEKPGLTLTEMIDGIHDGKIRALYIMGENPVVSDPDVTHVKEALAKLEFLAVQDIFPSDTAEYAHVILPAATFAEKDGTFTNTERRVQKIRKAVPPAGESKPDYEIICELSKRMGYAMDYRAAHEIMEEIAILTPSYGGILHHRLDANFGLQWPCLGMDHPGTPYLHRKKFTRGMGAFIPVEFIPPAEPTNGEFPFILTTGRSYFHYHTGTMCRRTATLEREEPECTAEINPADAERLEIRANEPVRIKSRRGSIEVKARVTGTVPEGIIFIPFHFREAAVNLLTINAVDPNAKIPEFKVCAVAIEPVQRKPGTRPAPPLSYYEGMRIGLDLYIPPEEMLPIK
ncbi:MAG TPA: formate dehydrogenase subunit alpha [Nitrospirota bacterium]|nr:formate dehydrogenase subunit alpha [Nitrospirota bacterium]